MFEAKNTKVHNIEGAIMAAGYPHTTGDVGDFLNNNGIEDRIERARRLGRVKSGTGHDSFLKGIIVTADFKVSGYMLPQMMRYSWFEIVSSQSKMAMIKKMDLKNVNKYTSQIVVWQVSILRDEYLADPTYERFMILISSIPMGLELWMHVSLNYLQIKTMVQQRRNHRLKEDWGEFVSWAESLPMFTELVTK